MMAVSGSQTLVNGELESPPPPQPPQAEDEPSKGNSLSSLGRQSSIYSLTLDEFQHTICEGGKNFGSMNMDEFLNNIWTAEENQATTTINDASHQSNQNEPSEERSTVITKQPSLPRQGSLTLPAPLCRKTVEEVWSEIQKDQQQQKQQSNSFGSTGTTQRQPTFGEMTLEDFLIKAGVVREAACCPNPQNQLQTPASVAVPLPVPASAPQTYGLYQNNNAGVDPNFRIGPVINLGLADQRNGGNAMSRGAGPTYTTFPQTGGIVGDSTTYGGSMKRNGYTGTMCFGGRVGNGSGYSAAQPLRMGSPASTVSSDGIGANQVDNAGQYGLELSGIRGRKRIVDGPVEKVVERRQRRMIKNRESAARSRARKQAYTVELEAELNQLKEENDRLKYSLKEAEIQRRQQLMEAVEERPRTRRERMAERLKATRRSLSMP